MRCACRRVDFESLLRQVVVLDLYDDPCNLPSATIGRAVLPAGTHTATIETYAGDGSFFQPPCLWVRHLPSITTSTYRSDGPAAAIDYYYFAGDSIDGSIALYREATGAAPLPPKGIFGFMHSTDRYPDQASLAGGAEGFRAGGYALDTIVQDWYFWPSGNENLLANHGFDPARYADPAVMTAGLRALNVSLMVTYWPDISPNNSLHDALDRASALLGSACDQYSPAGRDLYYGCVPMPHHLPLPRRTIPLPRCTLHCHAAHANQLVARPRYANSTKYGMGVDYSWLDSTDCMPGQDNYLGPGPDYALTCAWHGGVC